MELSEVISFNIVFEKLKIINEKKTEIKNLFASFFLNLEKNKLNIFSFLNSLYVKRNLKFLNSSDELDILPTFYEDFIKSFEMNIEKGEGIGDSMGDFNVFLIKYLNKEQIISKKKKKNFIFSKFKNIKQDSLVNLNKMYNGEIHQEVIQICKPFRFFYNEKNIEKKNFILEKIDETDDDEIIKKNNETLQQLLEEHIKKNLSEKNKNDQNNKYLCLFIKEKIELIIKSLKKSQRSKIVDKFDKGTDNLVKKGVKRVIKYKTNQNFKKSKNNGKFLKKNNNSTESELFDYK
jgi:hypothetical protein